MAESAGASPEMAAVAVVWVEAAVSVATLGPDDAFTLLDDGARALDDGARVVADNAAEASVAGVRGIGDEAIATGVGIENLRLSVKPSELRSGHARSKHGVTREAEAELLNEPDRVLSGTNEGGKRVDVYWRADGSVAITEAGDKIQTFTDYGPVSQKGPNDPVDPTRWATDPNFVEIDLIQPAPI